MVEWLLASIDISRPHDLGFEASWHGRLMVLAWSFLVPIGIFAARFFKVLPRQDWPKVLDHQAWWITHLVAQYAASILMIIAVWLIWDVSGTREDAFLHHFMGWTTVSLCGVQFLAGWLRGTKGGPTEIARAGTIRGDHFDMTLRRITFERIHKCVGYVCLSAAIVAVFSGMWIVNAPHWMWLLLVAWWVVVIFAFFRFQKVLGVIDTYQAIWGADAQLPGNQMQPIGIGVTRRKVENDSNSGVK